MSKDLLANAEIAEVVIDFLVAELAHPEVEEWERLSSPRTSVS